MKSINDILGGCDLQEKLAMMEKRRIEAKEIAERKREEDEKNKVVRLPAWSDLSRGTPNAVLRGALFAGIQGKNRRAMKRELLVDDKKLQVRFTGIQLDQSDLDVWEYALHLAKDQPLGHPIYFAFYSFLKGLGRSTGHSQHEWLKDCFARLIGCGVEITHNDYTYGGSLLEFERDEVTGQYKLEINPKMARLYDAGWTAIDWKNRRKISRKPLALWLYGYISTHVEIYPTKLETFQKLSGSNTKELRKFKQIMKGALSDLLKADLIKSYSIDDGNKVRIHKEPSASQQKVLDKN